MGDEVLSGDWTVLSDVLNRSTVWADPALLSADSVDITVELGEAPLGGLHDLLTSRELELGTTKSLNDVRSVGVLGTDRENNLTDLDTGSHLHWLTVGTSHTGGETIGSGTGKHLVLTNDVERVSTATDVVTLLTSVLDEVLVTGDTSGLKSTGGNLLLLVRD